MSYCQKSKFSINRRDDNYQQHPNLLRVRILKQELKEEKLRDKLVYQSIKEKIEYHQ